MVRQARNHPVIRGIAASPVWDERSDERESPRETS
jgi:hypothetical protein